MVTKTYYKTKDYCKVKFSLEGVSAETVEILGLNSNWNTPIPMNRRKDGRFMTDVNLPKGTRHEFKYLLDTSRWENDAEADTETPNPYGGTNSVIVL